MSRTLLVVLIVVSGAGAQLPQGLRDKLKHDIPSTRQDAVRELGAMEPTAKVSAVLVASTLAAALKDKDQDVRAAAAGLLGSGRPADIAVPALARALALVEDEAKAVRRVLVAEAADPKRGSSLGMGAVGSLNTYAGTILMSLENHWDERTAAAVITVVKNWKLEHAPGDTVRRACVLLSRWRTRPALDTVVDVIVRAQVVPASVRSTNEKLALIEPVNKAQMAEILAALDSAATASGAEKPAAFNASSPADWKAMLIANAPKFPWKLAESRPTSSPAQSRPADK